MDNVIEKIAPAGTEAAAAPHAEAAGWRNWSRRRWGLVALVIFVMACLLRETGMYDFHLSHETANTNTTYSTKRRSPRPPLRIVRWSEVREGVQLDFENGSKALLTVDRLTFSGLTWFPLYKRFSGQARTSLRSDDGLLTGTSEGSIQVTIWGISSSRRSRYYARVALLNQICQSLASQPQ